MLVVSSLPGEIRHWSQQWRQNTSRAEQKPVVDWKNDLQIQGAGRKLRKQQTPFVRIKLYGKSQLTRVAVVGATWFIQSYNYFCPARTRSFSLKMIKTAYDSREPEIGNLNLI